MFYHGQIEYGSKKHYWWNCTKDSIAEILVVPFINGQVVTATVDGHQRIFNMKTASFLRLFKTKNKLQKLDNKNVADQIAAESFQDNDCTTELLQEIQASKSFAPSSSLLQKAFQPPKPQVFVIMKFGDDILDSAYEGAYKPIVEKFGLKCVRIDEIQDSGKISDQILEKIAESKYIIADLTGSRPNCYYETGFAHALGKELILLAKNDESVHFDLQGHRFIQWKTESELRRKLEDRLKVLEKSPSRSG